MYDPTRVSVEMLQRLTLIELAASLAAKELMALGQLSEQLLGRDRE